MNTVDRVELTGRGKAYETCCRLAAMAGAPRPSFVEWGKIYKTPDGNFRIVSELRSNGRTAEECERTGRLVKLPKGETFHDLVAFLERVELTGP